MPGTDKKDENASDSDCTIETTHELQPIDVLVGSQVKSLRISVGMSEEELGATVGVSAETIRVCESGARRFGARLLYEISLGLDCQPTFFFDDALSVENRSLPIGRARNGNSETS